MTQERAQKRRETIHLEIDRDETHIFSKVDYAKEAQRVLGGDVVQYTEIRENETVIEKELLSEMTKMLERSIHIAENYRNEPEYSAAMELGKQYGFGALMAALSTAWRDNLKTEYGIEGGEFVVGTCTAIAEGILMRLKSLDQT